MTASVRDIRKARNLTLKQVAEHIGLSEGQASRIERGGTKSLPVAMKLAELLEVPVETFAPENDRAA